MKKIWPKKTRIYWDPEYNIPIVKPLPGQEDLFYILKLTEPGDARPAFHIDHERLINAIKYEFGDEKIYNAFFKDYFTLLNKVPHWDQMWETIASGNVLGQLYYDPFRERWRFRLNYAGAYIAVRDGLVDLVKTSSKVFRGTYINKSSTSSRQVVIINEKDEIVGIGENVGDKIIVIKTFREKRLPVETSMKKSNLETVLKHNDYGIEFYRRKAVKFLRKLYEKNKLPIVVSYSGGKDSLTALNLTLEAFGDAELLFNDTGLELPETIKNVEHVSKHYGLKLVKASAGDAFWKSVWIFGPPGKDYRWCCKVAKLVPIARVTRAKWGNGALNIVGQRAYESIDRARSPSVWRNRWVPHLLSASPIQEWNQLVEWLYIIKYKLPYNKLYDIGFERLGCYVCPSSTLAEFKEIEKHYPEEWRKWINVLEYWRKKLDQPIEWIKYGLWRWLTPAVAKYRLARHIPGYNVDWRREYILRLLNSTVNLAPLKTSSINEHLTIIFNKNIIIDEAQQQLIHNILMLKKKIYRDNDKIIIETKNTSIIIEKNKVEVYPYKEPENLEDLVDLLKIIYRIYGCAKCGSCVLWCPLKIIKLTKYGPIPTKPCMGCRICLEVCPISEILVEKVVLPLITNDPGIWKRPSRKHGLEVIETFRMAGIIPGET
ncbi:phosphoadenosine phosphosulfate reductase family protein [Staphylothermus hellenicus]|uniref:Phosphoadenosine phosphosulfate reductase n=1 Tax=Staphylothermus hellenicus (strain DSM 12710 / JCM 10830 / BK20S6-10-b1 / P8) TaxID=591019 RepID=D7D9U6_STAHD|nr:phosphoadenosine phosphosulfate reductase family protein [Staphylothermus hellenicus]ADI32542.1 phosphoadenosine phosphosulfate reductase [Staphylothermus hellenicus DSM 12710]